MTAPTRKLVDLPKRPAQVSRAACEAAEDLYDMGARGDVAGYAVVVLDHDGSLHLHRGFGDRLDLLGALEALKLTVWES